MCGRDMRTSLSGAGLGVRDIDEIISFVNIAELHGTHLSLKDALNLASAEMSEEEFASAWALSSDLTSDYPLHSGQIVSGQTLSEQGSGGIARKIEVGIRRVEVNMRTARAVLNIFSHDDLRMFSVSGGNSYNFARPGDDVDIFCVTRTNGLWRFIMKQLLVARFYGLFRKDIPRLCFSYILDEENAKGAFHSPQDRLFARDALSLKVISGRTFFGSLIGEARWMEGWFPKAYKASAQTSENPNLVQRGSAADRVLNLVLYRMIGSYIRLKSVLDNAKNRRAGRDQFVNHIKMGEGYLLHESRKYQALRGIYESFGSKARDANPPLRR